MGGVARISDDLVRRALKLLMAQRGVRSGADAARRTGLTESTVSRMLGGAQLKPNNVGAFLDGLGFDAYDLARALDLAEGKEPAPPAGTLAEPPATYGDFDDLAKKMADTLADLSDQWRRRIVRHD